jgi:hypothetical protein
MPSERFLGLGEGKINSLIPGRWGRFIGELPLTVNWLFLVFCGSILSKLLF